MTLGLSIRSTLVFVAFAYVLGCVLWTPSDDCLFDGVRVASWDVYGSLLVYSMCLGRSNTFLLTMHLVIES